MQQPFVMLGGTFDPVHNGHLRIAWEAAEALAAKVHLVPCHAPVHRPAPIATPEQRANMLRIALAGQDRLVLDERELRRPGESFTFDTLVDLRAELGPESPIILLLGADSFAGLPNWKNWRELFDFAHMVVLNRPGSSAVFPDDLEQEVRSRRARDADSLKIVPAGHIFCLRVSELSISASAIRTMLAHGNSPRYMVPDGLLSEEAILAPYRC